MSKSLYLNANATRAILQDLARRTLISCPTDACELCHYEPDPERDKLMRAVAQTYQTEMIRVTKLIHSKPSAAVHAFARAFRLKKDD